MDDQVLEITYIIVAGYHLAVANIIADTVPLLVRVDFFHLVGLVFGLLFPVILAALGSLDIRNCLLAVLGRCDLALWWWLPTGTGACRHWRSKRRLTEDAVSTRVANGSAFIGLWLFTLSLWCGDVAASRAGAQYDGRLD